MSVKLYFAPLPPRAIADDGLSGLDLRVLACIALHDGMSGKRNKGQGCWAGNRTLAKETGCDYTSLSKSITKLGRLGYLERAIHPLNKRLRVYRVLYHDGDLTVGQSANNGPVTVGQVANRKLKTVGRDFGKAQRGQGFTEVNIFRETENKLGRSLERDSVETAPPEGNEPNLGAELATFERAFKAGKIIKQAELEAWGDRLSQIHLEGDIHDPNAQRAGRLVDEVWHELAKRGP